jgi:CheY-like chemotaxis protein
MSDSRSLKDDHPLPYPGASEASEGIRQKAQDVRETARDHRAQTHTILSRTRQLLKQTEEIVQHCQAQREYEAEHAAPHAIPAARAGVDILLIEDDPADVALFRYIIDKYALPCGLTVLSQRSDVEAFFTEAATTAPLSLPRLFISDYRIPGMEFDEIMAAVRMVPAYRRVPVILFSTIPEEEGQRLSGACGATLFVHKPGEWDALVRRCLRWCAAGGGLDGSVDVPPARLH